MATIEPGSPAREDAFLAKYEWLSQDRLGGPAAGLLAGFGATVLVTPTRVCDR